MDENQNGTYGGEAPRTYGEESKLFEQGGVQGADVGGQNGNPQNPYQQSYGNQQNPYQQPDMNQPGNQQNLYQQPNMNQPGNPQNPYQQPNMNQPGNPQNPYQQSYGNQQNPYQQQYVNSYQQPYYGTPPVYGTVKDVFCYILLAVMSLRVILSFPIAKMAMVYAGQYYSSNYGMFYRGYYQAISSDRTLMILSSLSRILTFVYIVFVVLDIVYVRKAGYKITGLILFAILLNMGYYVWRAHVLKRKMTVPVIFTVVYSLAWVTYYFYMLYMAFTIAFNIYAPFF